MRAGDKFWKPSFQTISPGLGPSGCHFEDSYVLTVGLFNISCDVIGGMRRRPIKGRAACLCWMMKALFCCFWELGRRELVCAPGRAAGAGST